MKLNLKPGQGVIVGLHECIFAHTNTKKSEVLDSQDK